MKTYEASGYIERNNIQYRIKLFGEIFISEHMIEYDIRMYHKEGMLTEYVQNILKETLQIELIPSYPFTNADCELLQSNSNNARAIRVDYKIYRFVLVVNATVENPEYLLEI